MATTNYALPTVSSSDTPNGASQITALANATDLGILAVGKLAYDTSVSSGTYTATPTYTTVAGLTTSSITLASQRLVKFEWTFKVESTAAGRVQIVVADNGTALATTTQIIDVRVGGASGQVVLAFMGMATVAAGAHVFSVQIAGITGGGNYYNDPGWFLAHDCGPI